MLITFPNILQQTDERKLADITERLEHMKTVAITLQQHLITPQQEIACLSQELEQKRNHVSTFRQQVTMLQRLVRQYNGSTTTINSDEGLSKEKERGRGCYGAMYEVQVNGSACIAKRLHDILVGRKEMEPVGDEQRTAVISRFRRECDILSCLRHPNIVQMLGVHCGSDKANISLSMDMHMDLEHCMKTYPDIPLSYKISILSDVAYGLEYLHSKAIIHRDLNAGNVLLTEALRAKIADHEMSNLFDIKEVMQQTETVFFPTALDFMPTESLTKTPNYSNKLDIFSFGLHLTVYLVNQEEPHVDDNSLAPGDVERKKLWGVAGRSLPSSFYWLPTGQECHSDSGQQWNRGDDGNHLTDHSSDPVHHDTCQTGSHKNTLERLTIVSTLRSSSKEQKEVLKEMEQYNTQLKSSNQVCMLVWIHQFYYYYYASVGRASEAYGSCRACVHVCVCVCVSHTSRWLFAFSPQLITEN